MARVQLDKMRVCALKKYREPLLQDLQRQGVTQLLDVTPPEEDEAAFHKTNTLSERSACERNIQLCRGALEVLDKYAPVKASPLAPLEGRQSLSPEEWAKRSAERQAQEETARQLTGLAKTISECATETGRLNAQIQGLEPWLELDVPLNFAGTAQTAAFIGSYVGEHTEPELEESIQKAAEGIDAFLITVISHSKEQTNVFALCLKKDREIFEAALRASGFSLPGLPGDETPARQKQLLIEQLQACQKKSEEAAAQICALADQRQGIEFLMDDSAVQIEQSKNRDLLLSTSHVFLLTGYLPRKKEAAVQKRLEEKYAAVVEFEEPAPEENVPVSLQNNGFAAPVEGILSSFSLPGKGEIDPTFMMSLFYYFFFGMMLSDAGYGLVMVAACAFCLIKYKNMEPSWNKTLRMFLYSGISTTFWGAMYGSWFGDAPTVIASTFFGVDFTIQPLWMDPITQPMKVLTVCMAFGLVHLFAGLGCKIYQCVQNKDYIGIITDAVVWYLLVGGLILFGLSTEMFTGMLQVGFLLPASVGSVGKWMAILGAVGVVIAGGRGQKKPVMKLVTGLYNLYGSTSWLGDILSYSRLLGLGLATGVIGQVVNMMGSMMGASIPGVIVFVVVFLFGHTLNIAINLLGAYVHTNRLEYVEFFGKFYEGGGEEFSPFAVNTKFYKISEVK